MPRSQSGHTRHSNADHRSCSVSPGRPSNTMRSSRVESLIFDWLVRSITSRSTSGSSSGQQRLAVIGAVRQLRKRARRAHRPGSSPGPLSAAASSSASVEGSYGNT